MLLLSSVANSSIIVLRRCTLLPLRFSIQSLSFFSSPSSMDNNNFVPWYARATPSSGNGRGRAFDTRNDRERARGHGGGGGGRSGSGKDKIDYLGRLLMRILRHMASKLNLNMRSDGYVNVYDLLKLNLKTFSNIPLQSHTIDDIREAVRKDNKQRFSLIEENEELLIRANQGHTTRAVETESLLKPILSAEEFPGMRRDVNVLIYRDVRKALEEGMKLHISDNKVILTEGFEGVVPHKYFQKIESWSGREPIPF